MFYSEFSIDDVKTKLHLKIHEVAKIFDVISPVLPSALLTAILEENIPLALGIDTEKARSEMIVVPVLIELWRLCDRKISLFSGTELTVDREKGLTGVCDFILSRSPEQLVLNAPIFTLVEAKNDNIKPGIPQCIAEMVAAQVFNDRKGNQISAIYGAVTTGSIWKFLRLEGQVIAVETGEHFIEGVANILGILRKIVELTDSSPIPNSN